MSDVSQGPGWWIASDGKWYAPEQFTGLPPAMPAGPAGSGPDKPGKSRKALWIVLGSVVGLFVLLAIIGAATGSKKADVSNTAPTTSPSTTSSTSAPSTAAAPVTTRPAPTTTQPPPPTTTTTPPGPPPARVVKDGDFAFTVTGMQCGVTSVGTDPLTQTAPAGSQWCMVTMNVLNDKNSAQTFFASNQKAIDAQGRQLDADTAALIYMDNGSAAELSQLNPGISVTVVVPFQLATTDSIKQLELHDSAFSGGVTIAVS